MDNIEEEKSLKNIKGEEKVDLLKDSYDIDEESFQESDEEATNSKMTLGFSSASEQMENEKDFLDFIQAIKDDNWQCVKEYLEGDALNIKFIFQESHEGILPLQYAILFGNTKAAEILIDHGASLEGKLEGIPLLHLSLSFAIFTHFRKRSIECFHFLIKKSRDILLNQIDRLGRTIYHFICLNDLYECFNENLISLPTNALLVKDSNGDCLIDYFYIYNSKGCFYSIMNNHNNCFELYKEIIKNNSSFIEKCFLYNSIEILDILVDQAVNKNKELKELLLEEFQIFLQNESERDESLISRKEILEHYLSKLNTRENSARKNSEEITNALRPQSKTLIIYNSKCTLHGEFTDSNPILRIKRRMSQVENPDRLNVLFQPPFGVLLSDFCLQRFTFRESPEAACLADILRVHDFKYIEGIYNLCNSLKKENKANCYKYDADTYINKHTWDSAVSAAGCVIDAVDQIMDKEKSKNGPKNAFCLIRPPGHHAGYFGKVESPDKHCHSSNGFCFLNNVAIGAAYSMYKYKDQIKKIAIVDFDVHHGNGTQEIVKFLTKTNISIKSENKFGDVTINQTICNPWVDFNDAENVLFISTHGYDEEAPGRFYPSSGTLEENTEKDSSIYPGGILNVPIFGDTKLPYGYRNIFRMKILPRLIKFKPDIIFVSAGFDGHINEHINSSYMKLTEFDYRWITEELMKIANRFSNGRLISVLEGGYNINTGVVSSFAQSVLNHAKFLNICANKQTEKCVVLSKVKRKREFLKDYDNYKTLKKNRHEEFNTEIYSKDENKRESRYVLRSENENHVKEEIEFERNFFNKNETNFNSQYHNNDIFEMNRISADMKLNVDESDVDYMKVKENEYDKNYNLFSSNNFTNQHEHDKDDEDILIKSTEISKKLFNEEVPNFLNNNQDELNFFVSDEKKDTQEEKKEIVENSEKVENCPEAKNDLNIEANNIIDIDIGDHILYEEIEVEMDEDEPID